MNEMTKVVDSEEQSFGMMQRIAKVFYVSNMFPDLTSHAQAIVKVMAGRELGIAPFASIGGIHIVMGKPVIGANLIATLITKHPDYSYDILQCTKEICEIEFHDTSGDSDKVGVATFTIQEAIDAELLAKKGGIWLKYPSDMLFARCISRGARRFTPGIFGGTTVYTPDEMGVEHDEDGVINAKLIDNNKTHVEIVDREIIKNLSPTISQEEVNNLKPDPEFYKD